jgi:hypothetical protein
LTTRTTTTTRAAVLCSSIALLLIFALTRLYALTSFPPFLDEIIHVEWAEQSVRNPFLFTGQSRLLTVWLQMLVQSYRAETIWVMRAIMVLAVLPGVAAVLGIGRLFGGYKGMIIAGLLALFSTYHYFFERMALGDPFAASLALIGVFFAAQLHQRRCWHDAALSGLALFLAVLAKASILPFLGVPVAAALTLSPERSLRLLNWRAQLRWLAVALGVSLGLLLGLTVFARLIGQDFFMLFSAHNRSGLPLAEMLSRNMANTVEIATVYLGIVPLLGALLGVIVLLLRRQLFLPLCLIAPLLVLWLNESQFTRFFLASLQVLLLCGAIALVQLLDLIPTPRRRWGLAFAAALICLWGAGMWLPFALTSYSQPAALPLAPRDYDEYVRYDSGGFGLAEMLTAIRAQEGAPEVIGLLSNCIALRALAQRQPIIDCPTIKLSQQGIDDLAALVESKRGQPNVWVVWEAYPFVPPTIPGQVITEITRPAGGTRMVLYRLQ